MPRIRHSIETGGRVARSPSPRSVRARRSLTRMTKAELIAEGERRGLGLWEDQLKSQMIKFIEEWDDAH